MLYLETCRRNQIPLLLSMPPLNAECETYPAEPPVSFLLNIVTEAYEKPVG